VPQLGRGGEEAFSARWWQETHDVHDVEVGLSGSSGALGVGVGENVGGPVAAHEGDVGAAVGDVKPCRTEGALDPVDDPADLAIGPQHVAWPEVAVDEALVVLGWVAAQQREGVLPH